MRYVDHDPTAARRAAQVCRDRAADHDRVAAEVGLAVTGVAWWGEERDRVVRAVGEVCDDLRREAASLRRSADLLEAAARAAEAREVALAEDARRASVAAAAAAEERALQSLLTPVPVWGRPPTTLPSGTPAGAR